MESKATSWNGDKGVGLLTLSRPASHDAWTGRMHTELRHVLQRAKDDYREATEAFIEKRKPRWSDS